MDDLMQAPAAWWIEKTEQFCIKQPGVRPFAKVWLPLYTVDQMREYAKKAVEAERERCLKCYSPDDTATDWADKIRGLPLD